MGWTIGQALALRFQERARKRLLWKGFAALHDAARTAAEIEHTSAAPSCVQQLLSRCERLTSAALLMTSSPGWTTDTAGI